MPFFQQLCSYFDTTLVLVLYIGQTPVKYPDRNSLDGSRCFGGWGPL